jgi:hypothetical protein
MRKSRFFFIADGSRLSVCLHSSSADASCGVFVYLVTLAAKAAQEPSGDEQSDSLYSIDLLNKLVYLYCVFVERLDKGH